MKHKYLLICMILIALTALYAINALSQAEGEIPESSQWLYHPAAVFPALILGVLSHFLKKKIRGQTYSSVQKYFKTHFVNTIITLVGCAFAYISLEAIGPVNAVMAFMAGYTADSALNKAEGDK